MNLVALSGADCLIGGGAVGFFTPPEAEPPRMRGTLIRRVAPLGASTCAMIASCAESEFRFSAKLGEEPEVEVGLV